MKYTAYFFGKRDFRSTSNRSVANPMQEFHSLDDARTFAQNAASVSVQK